MAKALLKRLCYVRRDALGDQNPRSHRQGTSRKKYSKPTFISRYIFPGDHSYFCLHEFLAEAAKTKLEVLAVRDDRPNYYLTCKAWAENLEACREEIVGRWGEMLYRRFRLYLWGSAHAFLSHGMDAYRVVLQQPAGAGAETGAR
jgi:cyclopropane-fatty-acyl-phospholipid synthase